MTTSFGAAVIKAQLPQLPNAAGVYRMIGAGDTVLYVGKAKSLRKRVAAYARNYGHSPRIARMIAQTQRMEFILTSSEAAALLLEADLIKSLKPTYNILLRDDKTYPLILIRRDHDFAQIRTHRGAKNIKGDYIGPFASSAAAYDTVQTLQRAFLLRTCTDHVFANRRRPCLLHDIGRCSAPCTGNISAADYAQSVADATACLSGQSARVQHNMRTQMQQHAAAQQYEQAAQLRDRLRVLQNLASTDNVAELSEADVIALARDGGACAIATFMFRGGHSRGHMVTYPLADAEETDAALLSAYLGHFYQNRPVPPLVLLSHVPDDHALLAQALSQKAGVRVRLRVPKTGGKERDAVQQATLNATAALQRKQAERHGSAQLRAQLATLLGLDDTPQRIEIYDNSHIQGTHALGAMVVAGAEGFLKKEYRLYKHDAALLPTNDDYAMMRHMLQRRLRGLLDDAESTSSRQRPCLLMIDGGAGQLSMVCDALAEAGLSDIAVVAIAKGEDRNAGRERFYLPNREPFTLPHNDPLLHYVQRLRDEAHRFAIGAHRNARSKTMKGK